MPGPVPNRSDDLSRPRERRGHNAVPVTKGIARPATIPEADLSWHPIALKLWDSLLESGQSDFYQSSDWAFAFSLCEDLSTYKRSAKRSGQMLQVIYSAFERLLVAEGDRRRVRIELGDAEDDGQDAEVVAINDYKRSLGLVK